MTRNSLISFIVFILVFPGSMHAQHSVFKTYTVEDGLVSNPVRRIYQDAKGFIWIGTLEGLSKYDGNKFTNYNTTTGLSHNMVNDLYESADGKLYVAENNGAVDILHHDAIMKKSAFHNIVINQFAILQNRRVLATTDARGLFEFKDGNFIQPAQTFASSTYTTLIDLNDSLLIGGSEGTLHILDKHLNLFFELEQPRTLLIYKLFRDEKRQTWVATNSGLKQVSSFEQTNHKPVFSLVAAPFNIPALKGNIVNDILEDGQKVFWIATAGGLVKISPDGKWRLFSEKDGLPSADITCLYQDREKNIWIGTALGLAKLVTKNDIRIYTTENGMASHNATFLQPSNGNRLLIGTGSGIQSYDISTGVFSSVQTEDDIFYYCPVQNSRSGLFMGYDNRIGTYDPLRHYITSWNRSTVPAAIVYCSVMDANGIIFSGTQTGLLIRNGEATWYEHSFPYRITSLLIDHNGDLWAGTWDNGLFRIRYTKSDHNPNGKINDLSVLDISNLMPDKNIRCLFEDRSHHIWAGTRYNGLARLTPSKNGDSFTSQQFNLTHSLMSNFIRAIAEDKNGAIWIGSDLGIDKMVPAGGNFRVFNFSRVNNYFSPINGILPIDNHDLWVATGNGLVHILDGEIENTPAPALYITSVLLGDTNFHYNTYHPNAKVELKYYQNQARFEFSSPAFINEKQIIYSYRLLGGADTMWSKPANLHSISYASLRPGHYRFEVITKGWNEQWGRPTDFLFIVQGPYWQAWWFYLLEGFAASALIYALYRFRIRQVLQLQKVRNRIATDLHDDIGSTLTNINMLSEISRKNLQHPVEAAKYLQRISEEVTTSSQALNDIIWNVNSRNDSMNEMLSRMRRYAAELFDHSRTICHLFMDETMASKKINMEQRRDVYLIYKESMNNILKHAAADNVWIDMQWQNEKLYLMIKDDGKGFDPALVTNRSGLRNIHSRTEKWKGSTVIKTSPGNGTLIEIILPISG